MEAPQLRPEDRTRLRPTVDAAALERLLAAVPSEARSAIVLACLAEPSAADRTAAGVDPIKPGAESSFSFRFEDPELTALWRAVEPRRWRR
jgi:hypothetical protein